MGRGSAGDLARQVAVVLAVVFQTFGSALAPAGADQAAISDANRTLVVPADYAFVIWGPIFVLCLAYAVYQALPAQRRDGLQRRIGWWAAGAFAGNGLWQVVFPREQFVLAQVLLVAALVLAAAALARVVRAAPLTPARTWLVAVPLALLLGWLTDAALVGMATTLVATGVWSSSGTVEAVVGALLLLAGAGIAAAVLRAARPLPAAALLAYAGAVIWGLVAVALNQADDSVLTTGAAVVAALAVAGALAASLPRGRLSPRTA